MRIKLRADRPTRVRIKPGRSYRTRSPGGDFCPAVFTVTGRRRGAYLAQYRSQVRPGAISLSLPRDRPVIHAARGTGGSSPNRYTLSRYRSCGIAAGDCPRPRTSSLDLMRCRGRRGRARAT